MFWNRKSESEWTGPDDRAESVKPQTKQPRQYYSVGHAENDHIALTVYTDSGSSVTTVMNDVACRHLIRMLQSALDNSDELHNTEE
jgi:DNA-directed RNA polymerase subunit L